MSAEAQNRAATGTAAPNEQQDQKKKEFSGFEEDDEFEEFEEDGRWIE